MTEEPATALPAVGSMHLASGAFDAGLDVVFWLTIYVVSVSSFIS